MAVRLRRCNMPWQLDRRNVSEMSVRSALLSMASVEHAPCPWEMTRCWCIAADAADTPDMGTLTLAAIVRHALTMSGMSAQVRQGP